MEPEYVARTMTRRHDERSLGREKAYWRHG